MPVFSKLLTDTDVLKRLAIPTGCLEHLSSGKGENSVPFHVVDENGEKWNFVCSTRSKGYYPKPCLSRGWRHFVRSKGLRVGDRIVFHKDAEAETYKIGVQRKIMLFGEEIWSDCPPDQQRVDFEKTKQNSLHQPTTDQENVDFEKTAAAAAGAFSEAAAAAEAKENEQ
ncbi:hypothetical protein DITRI_Ditri09bG0150500 [Diplodiscus trichospermus]